MAPKLVLYGAGEIGIKWIEKLGKDKVLCFVDSDKNKIGTIMNGVKVHGIDFLINNNDEFYIFISANEKNRLEIEKKLRDNGLGSKIIRTPYWETDNFVHWSATVSDVHLEGKNYIGSKTQLWKCNLGYASYVANNSKLVNAQIGKFSAIGSNVDVIIGQHPTTDFVSIHPAFFSIDNVIGYSFVKEKKFEEVRTVKGKYSVVIGNDVWIGNDVKIMEGVTVADGSIIAAGGIVTQDTKPYSINGGVPTKLIKYRFSEEILEKLCKLKWWDKDIEWIKNHAELFSDVEKFLNYIENE